MELRGNTDGIKKETIKQLLTLADSSYPRDLLILPQLAQQLGYYSSLIQREIAIYLDRNGHIIEMMVGDRHTVALPEAMKRRSQENLSGVRCIHTHLAGGSQLSSLDIASLLEGRLDAMVALGVANSSIISLHAAFPDNKNGYIIYGPLHLADLENFNFLEIIKETEKEKTKPSAIPTAETTNRALLIGFKEQKGSLLTGEESLQELKELAHTAGIAIHSSIIVSISRPDPAFYLGRGKVREIGLFRQQEGIDLVIIDDLLSPRQQRNLENSLQCSVIDRTALILQIFAGRAQTKEGKLQVELAQLNYLLPRLTGFGQELSRLGGGIGTRGPGEAKLETDKRRVLMRISDLQREIEVVRKQRSILRKRRQENKIPVIALVGYTNAGKSTLMNALTQAGVLVEDKLFATLDPTTRRLQIDEQEVLLTDTVGFIHKLPHLVVAAFRATLEEINHADLLLHVVDASSPALEAHLQSVRSVLEEIGAGDKPSFVVFNKWDLVTDSIELQDQLSINNPSLPVSALTGYNLQELMRMMGQHLPNRPKLAALLIPYDNASVVNDLYEHAQVINLDYTEEGIHADVYLNDALYARMRQFLHRKVKE